MSINPCLAKIRGLPEYPSIIEVNVRSGPGTNFDIAFKGPVGMSGLQILEVKTDDEKNGENGKTYQWFKLVFHGGAQGWIRDDLLEIQGECGDYGYSTVAEDTHAFALNRTLQTAKPADDMTTQKPTSPSTDAPALEGIERVKKASFAVTATFEGTGYAAYNNYDAGIISYGLIQFTMAAGSLITVLDKYLATSKTGTSNELRKYMDRIRARDEALRQDKVLKNLLVTAANEPEMRIAQDEVATVNYWDKVVDGYITHRGLKTPLAYALLFDMGVNFGTGHGFVRLAEEQLGVPSRSRPGENGITEEQLITRVAELRKQSHDKQAARDNLPGLRVRGDFWVNLVTTGDWNFIGDASGFVNVNGRNVQVANP